MNEKVVMEKVGGGTVILDTSDKACREFKVRFGEIFKDPFGDEAEAVGVGPRAPGEPETLWVVYLDNNPREEVSYFEILLD